MGLPYYTLYPSDFDTDEKVRLMEDDELGLYLRCMNHAWLNDGLPPDPEDIRRALRDSPEAFARKWQRVQECFPLGEGGRRRNPRQERERAAAIDKTEKAKRGAAASWQSRRKADAVRKQSECIADAMPRAYDSDSDIGSVVSSEGGAGGNLREFPKATPAPDVSSLWAAAGFSGPDEAADWWKSLLARHPNRNRNGAAFGRFCELVQLGQFDRSEFNRWYEEEIPIWQEWQTRGVQAKNMNEIFQDRLWAFPKTDRPTVRKSDRERGLAG